MMNSTSSAEGMSPSKVEASTALYFTQRHSGLTAALASDNEQPFPSEISSKVMASLENKRRQGRYDSRYKVE